MRDHEESADMSETTDTERCILVLEDDEDIAAALARGLRRAGYEPLVAHDLTSAKATIADASLHAAVIDVMLGDEDGLAMVRHLRAAGVQIPVVLLSALSSVGERMAGLAAGADDYVAKPFDFAELVARIQVQELRRSDQPDQSLRYAHLTLCMEKRQVSGPQGSVRLTEREALLLAELLRRPERVISRRKLFDGVWKDECCSDNVVDVYIGYLRRKLSPEPAFGVQIDTVRGRGFMIRALPEGEDHG